MIFKKVSIENFKSIGNTVTLDLSKNGACLISGYNGSGKTSLIESIIWCIYGITKLKADDVVNKFVGEGTKVELEFSEGGKDYILTRYRKHKIHKNNVYIFENGENISLKNQVDTQELIQKIVGVDSKAFMSSIILSSETYKHFLRETNSVRLQIFESVFSLRELNDFKKLALQKIKTLENIINDKVNELNSIKAYNLADTNSLKSYKENYQNQIEKLDSQIALYKMNLEKCKTDLANGQELDFDAEMKKAIEHQAKLRIFNDELKKNQSLMELISSYDSRINSLNEIRAEYEKTINTYSIDFFKAELKKISDYEENIKKYSEINEQIVKNNSDIKSTKDKLALVKKQIDSLIISRDAVKKKISEIKENICPTCGHHLDDSKSKELKESYEHEFFNFENQIGDLEKDEYNLEEISLKEFETIKTSLEKSISEIDITKPKYSQQEIKFLAERYKEAYNNISKVAIDIADAEGERVKIASKIKSGTTVPPEYDGYTVEWLNENRSKQVRLASEIESLKNQIETAENMKVSAFDKTYVKKIMDSIKKRNTLIEKINSEIFSNKKELSEYEILDGIFSNGENGFKKYFINKTINMFNEKINTFLPFFFEDSIEIKFDKNLNESIIFRGKEADFNELSSGEKTRAEMCVIFSMYFMVQSLFGCGTNLLVVDELLDRGLDAQGIKAAKGILDDISKDASVFVVTHRDDLKELFNNSITVYKDGDGFTQLK